MKTTRTEAARAKKRSLGSLASALPLSLLLGCVSNTVTLLDDDGGSSGSSGPSSGGSTLDPATSGTTIPEPADGTSTTDDLTTGVQLIPPPDGGPLIVDCDIFAQDCPAGYKCMPWAPDGGSSWNGTRCSPIAEDPAGIDEPCMVEGSPTSGVDDCELSAMCWDVDPKTLEGTCIPLCIGTESDPYCADPMRECAYGSDGALFLCLRTCDPLVQDCPASEACYPIQDSWSCAPDASGDMGAYGDPCEFINVCDPGLVCLLSEAVPPGQPCEDAIGCCTEVCNVFDPLGDLQCMSAAEGQTCQPWWEEGSAPLGYDHVGVCALPL
ncbi:hypothetical protein [Paraliomyxa miuraensis]|uniref:hypothetical protein n=1 Tax=Paraliomyxa miuraensis TaxID=376150 RepID=UPI0022558B63|nr:hypothetical protein [Paraliomyxa miuraensis]MCX4241142.1 hypothetical protein [Paraliomyxa miuraensis]